METKKIEQVEKFDASPKEIYGLIMDSEKHTKFSGSEAKMSDEVGGEFSTYDGYCHGTNIELVPGEKIVQDWHFEEDGWPEDHFSRVTFIFENDGDGTKLTFTQEGIPEHKVEALESGWKEYYWEPMRQCLEENK